MSILCLTNICTNTCSASADLVGDYIFFFSLSSLTRFIIDTAKSNDISGNLLSDTCITPHKLYYTIVFSEAQGVALREVMPYVIVKYCTSHKVKSSVPLTPAGTSRCKASLHAPKVYLSCLRHT